MSALAIYQPKGKAAEYASWACNLYTGCSNGCDYCYCRRGSLGSIWTPEPRLKSCFRDEEHAFAVFIKELEQNEEALRKDGLFFSFTTDPMLPATRRLHWRCAVKAMERDVPVMLLTKCAGFIDDLGISIWKGNAAVNAAWGFTITGFDEREGLSAKNGARVDEMKVLHDMGFRTFASLEPVIDPFVTAAWVHVLSKEHGCDFLMCGLESGRKETYDLQALRFLQQTIEHSGIPFYLKHSFTKALGSHPMEPKTVFQI